MKKIAITLILVSISFITYAQKYYSLKECGNDPLKYIERNYQDNADKYIGKTIGFWADECEIQLGYFIPGQYSPWGPNKHLRGNIENIMFEIHYLDYEYDIYIYIDSSTLLNWKEAVELEGDYDEPWGPKFYDFYKNAKIKEISIVKINNENYNIDYRRP